jgi:hypothetical protein
MMPRKISKATAIKRGLKLYFTGKPCCRGHVAQRYASSSHCLLCVADDGKKPETKERQRRYNASPEGRARTRRGNTSLKGVARRLRYKASAKSYECDLRYRTSAKGRERDRRYRSGAKGVERDLRYKSSPKYLARMMERERKPERIKKQAIARWKRAIDATRDDYNPAKAERARIKLYQQEGYIA